MTHNKETNWKERHIFKQVFAEGGFGMCVCGLPKDSPLHGHSQPSEETDRPMTDGEAEITAGLDEYFAPYTDIEGVVPSEDQ